MNYTGFFFIRNQFIRNLHVESQKIKKLLQLHCHDHFLNKKLYSIFDFLFEEIVLKANYITNKLDDCRTLNVDNSEDYLKFDDFSGIDVILLD